MQSQQSADLHYIGGISVVGSWKSADVPPSVPWICWSAL